MSRVEQFEDLSGWQKARVLTKAISRVSRTGDFSEDWGLRNQIQRAAVSIMSNISEGFKRGNRGEFHQFIVIAKASCAEVRSQLYVAYDAGYITEIEFSQLTSQAREVGRMLGGLRLSLERQRDEQRRMR